jgi:seryl-tRNA(Sec) selenium transferase
LTRSIGLQESIARKIKKEIAKNINIVVEIVNASGRVGSGAYPLMEIPAFSLKISVKNWPPDRISRYFRMQTVPIIGYIHNNQFHLNMLTLFQEDIDDLIKTLNDIK